MALSTVSAVPRADRARQALAARAARAAQPLRARARPGELVHVDVKKLGRIRGGAGHRVPATAARPDPHRRRPPARAAGWEFVHVCVDDATRLAYVEVLADEQATTAIAFLRRALGVLPRHGIRVER